MGREDKEWPRELERILANLAKSHSVKPLYRENFPRIGQMQLLRRHTAIELGSNAKLETAT